MKKYAPLVLVVLLFVGIASVVIYAEKLSNQAREASTQSMAQMAKITSLKMEISKLKLQHESALKSEREKLTESDRVLKIYQKEISRIYNELLAAQDELAASKTKAQAEAARKERIRQQNLAAQRQQREAALQFAAQQRAEQADTSAAQSDMAATAQSAAEAYFRNDYRPGGNSSVLVMEVSATVTTVEQVPGWSGRWRARGRASIGYYVSSGGSFARESHDFDVELGNGSPKVEVRS